MEFAGSISQVWSKWVDKGGGGCRRRSRAAAATACRRPQRGKDGLEVGSLVWVPVRAAGHQGLQGGAEASPGLHQPSQGLNQHV